MLHHFVLASVKAFRKDETACGMSANLCYFFVGCGTLEAPGQEKCHDRDNVIPTQWWPQTSVFTVRAILAKRRLLAPLHPQGLAAAKVKRL